MSERRWFVLHSAGGKSGPMTTTEVIRALLDERVAAEDRLSEEGSSGSEEVRNIAEFRIAVKAVRATMQRRQSSRPPQGFAQPAGRDEEDEEPETRYFMPGAEAAKRVAAEREVRAAPDEDEDEVRTKYFQAGVDHKGSGIQAAPPASPREEPAAPRRASPPLQPARHAPPPPPPAPRARPAPPPVPSRSGQVRPAPPPIPGSRTDDDEEELKTAYFQPGAGKQAPRSPRDPAPPVSEGDEEEVKTQYFQPGAREPQGPAPPPAQPQRTASPAGRVPYAAPSAAPSIEPAYAGVERGASNVAIAPSAAATSRALPMQAPAAARQGLAPPQDRAPPAVQPRPMAPVPVSYPNAPVSPTAMTVAIQRAGPTGPPLATIIAGLLAFLVTLIVAAIFAYLLLMRQ